MRFNARKDRKIRHRLRHQKKYKPNFRRYREAQALQNATTHVKGLSGYGDSLLFDNTQDNYYVPGHFVSRDIASEMGEIFDTTQDKYYVPGHFVPRDVASELGNFKGVKHNLVVAGAVLALAYFLIK